MITGSVMILIKLNKNMMQLGLLNYILSRYSYVNNN